MAKTGFQAPPPSYAESLSAPRLSGAISGAVDTHLLPHVQNAIVNQIASTIVVFIPSNVSTLSLPSEHSSEKEVTPTAFPGETLVGFPTSPSIIRLSGAENSLEIWRRASALKELAAQIRSTLEGEGYSIIQGSPKPPSSATIAGSRHVDWKSQERKILGAGEAKIAVEVEEVCLRIENEMGLYETRTGRAIVARVEIGVRDGGDEE